MNSTFYELRLEDKPRQEVKSTTKSALLKEFVSEVCYLKTLLIAKIREYRSHKMIESEFIRCPAADRFEVLYATTHTHIHKHVFPYLIIQGGL
jgi:hypothetical protein